MISKLLRTQLPKRSLKATKCRIFSVLSKTNDYLKDLESNLEKIEENELINNELLEQLYKVYLTDQKNKELEKKCDDVFQNAIWHSDEAIKVVLGEFTRTLDQVGYNSEIMVKTFEAVAKVLAVRNTNVSGYELSGTYLVHDFAFETLINTFKYALLQASFITGTHIARSLRALKSMGYKDIELAKLVMKKLTSGDYYKHQPPKKISDFKNEEELVDLPFSGKKNFMPGFRSFDPKTIDDKLANFITKIQNIKFDKDTEHNDSNTSTGDILEMENELQALASVVKEGNSAVASLASSILKMRDDYFTLTGAQKNRFVLENPSLLVDLLELEESFLELGIIDIEDIFHVKSNPGKPFPKEMSKIKGLISQFIVENKLPIETLTFPLPEELRPKKQSSPTGKLLFGNSKSSNPDDVVETPSNEKSVAGCYASSLLDGLEGLVDYALLDIPDLHENETYTVEGLTQLVHEHISELEHARNDGDFPMTDEEGWMSNPIRDERRANAASIHYHKLFHSVSTFIEQLYNGKVSTGANLKNEIEGDVAAEVYFEQILKKSAANIKITHKTKANLEHLKVYLDKKISQFWNGTKTDKINILYELALAGTSNQNILKEFISLFKTYTSSEAHLYDLCCISSYKFVPFPEELDKLIIVFIQAELNKIGSSPIIGDFFRELSVFEKFHLNTVDRDPLGSHAIEMFEIFSEIGNAELQRNIGAVAVKNIPRHLLPNYYMRTVTGKNIVLFNASPEDYGFADLKNMDIASVDAPKYQILASYFSKLIDEQITAIALPFELLMKTPSQFYRGKVEQFGLAKNTEKILMSIIGKINSDEFNHKDSSSNSGIHKNIVLSKFVHGLEYTINEFESDNKFDRITGLCKSFITIYYRSIGGEGDQAALVALQNICFEINTAFGKLGYIQQRKIAEFVGAQKVENFASHLKKVNQQLQQNFSSIENTGPHAIFQGKRYGLEIIPEQKNRQKASKLPDIEYLSYYFLRDPEFVAYSNWKDILLQGIEEASKVIDTDKSIYFRYGLYNPGYYPVGQHFNNFYAPNLFSLNWELFAYETTTKNQELKEANELLVHNTSSNAISSLIYNIQRLKHTIKMSDNYKQKLEQILQMRIFSKILDSHISLLEQKREDSEEAPKNLDIQKLPRNFNSYVEYRNRIAGIRAEDNAYMRVVKQEASHIENVKYWAKVLYEKIPKLLASIKQSNKSPKQLLKFKTHARRKYYEALKKVDSRVRDTVTTTSAFGLREKIFDLKYDPSILENRTYYQVESDADFIAAKGNEGRFMELKKIRAETNLIKFFIIIDIIEGRKLTQAKSKYIKEWSTHILSGEKTEFMPSTYSQLTFGDLSQQDIATLHNTLGFEYSKSFDSFEFIELVFELAETINTSLVLEFEQALKSKLYNREWRINEITSSNGIGLNNMKKYLLDRIERAQWNKALQYTHRERDYIKKMASLGRGLGSVDKEYLETDMQSLDHFIDEINEVDERDELLDIWLERKNKEINKRCNFILKNLVRPDKELSKYYNTFYQKKVIKNIEIVFGKPHDSITTYDLSSFASNLSRRLYLFKNHLPRALAYVLVGVLRHPNLSEADKDLILSSLRIFQLNLNEYFKDEPLAKIGVLSFSQSSSSDKYTNKKEIRRLFQDADYNIQEILNSRLDSVVSTL